MWELLARFILRRRVGILVVLALLTIFMGYNASKVKLQWDLPKLLPDNDSTLLAHKEFKKIYGEGGAAFLLALNENPLEDLELFNGWYQLSVDLEQIEGIDTVIAINRLFNVVKNTEEKKFELKPICTGPLSSQQELDSLRMVIHSLPFYKGKIYNDTNGVNIMGVALNIKIFNSPAREPLVDSVMNRIDRFEAEYNIDVVESGLPYIRTKTTHLIKSELRSFIVLAIVVTIIILLLFFRSLPPVAVSMLIVGMGVIWSIGMIALLGYEITILTSIIPPLTIVIGIPNSIYLINKYHSEYLIHRNKILSLSRIIQKIGKATLMTNTTTAIGFLAFVFTHSAVLVEFGVVASINIIVLFMLSIFLIPSIFSFLPPPKDKHTKHLEVKWMIKVVDFLVNTVSLRRNTVYIITGAFVVIGIIGVLKIQTTGNLVDDLPQDHGVVTDLRFFEKNFNGVMPFEINVDTKKSKGATKTSTLKRLEKLEKLIESYPQFSKPLSIVDGIKFVKQAYYGGNPKKYQLINSQERIFFKKYIDNTMGKNESNVLRSFVDSTGRYTRVTVQMMDVGTKQMDALIADLRPRVDSIFSPEKYQVDFTGTSVVYLSGTNYLVNNLFTSLFLAIIIIAVLMAILFSSVRMVLISIFTNMIPLLFTAAIMGYFGIAIKPSTILVFSIAFGISIDDTIHFLAKYRQELKTTNWNIKEAVLEAIRETGVSMIYTSIILFFGFSVFATSQFGGTKALGVLVSVTLFIAMLSNLVLLPSFLLTMDKRVTTKAFKEPFFEIYDEESDIDHSSLTIRENDPYITKP